MGILISVVTVLFVILCVLLVILILLQSDKSAGMGLLGGSSQSTFGSSTADVITKITAVMIGLFMIGSLGLSILESKRTVSLRDKLKEKESAQPGGYIEKAPESGKPAEPNAPVKPENSGAKIPGPAK